MVTRQFSNFNWSRLTLKCAKINYFTECKALNHFVSMQYTTRLIIYKSPKKFKHVWRLNYCVNYFDAARHCNTENELNFVFEFPLIWLVRNSTSCKDPAVIGWIKTVQVSGYCRGNLTIYRLHFHYKYIRGNKLSVRGYLGTICNFGKK